MLKYIMRNYVDAHQFTISILTITISCLKSHAVVIYKNEQEKR